MSNKQANSLIPFLLSFFTRGHERSVKAKKNIVYSLVIKGISILISLILVPLTLHYVNPTQYGIWLTLTSIIGWFGFFDIGFGNGLRNKFAEALAKNEHDQARIYISTTYAALSIIIGVVLLLFLLINPFLNWAKILNTPAEMGNELRILALIVFVFFCIQFVLQLLTTVITANQEPAKASLFGLFGSILSLAVIFIMTQISKGSLIRLGIAFSLSPVIVLAISSLWFYRREYRKYAPSFKYVRFSYARDLMTLGMKFFVIQIAVVIIYQTSNIIIAQLFGPAQVTPYNIAYKYFSIIPMVFSIIMMPFWSAFTEAWVKEEYSWIKNIIKSLIKLWAIIGIVTLIMLLCSNLVYRLWVGKEIRVPNMLSAIMAVYVVLNAWGSIYSQFLNGVGKVKVQIYSAVICAVVNIPLSIFLGKRMGISGVILSTTILAFTSAIWSPIQYRLIITHKAKGIWNK